MKENQNKFNILNKKIKKFVVMEVDWIDFDVKLYFCS